MYRHFFKRLFDLLLSAVAFLVLSPVFVIVMILLFAANAGSPFFRQQRPGKKGKIFTIIKFRTMNNRKGSDGTLLPDSQRLTGVGKAVRSLSLDEIPQLLNVIIGDMSLVGPRPLLAEYLELYSDEQKKRHNVRPGITGWAQVHGRNTISWQQKFAYDVWYVEHFSFLVDMKIIGKTILKLFKPTDINSPTSATMEKFRGNFLI